MSIDIVIPNYNGSELIEKNLEYVLRSLEGFKGKVIIVDDGSSKSEFENVKRVVIGMNTANHKIELLRHIKNKGFASTVNTGVAFSDAEFVALLNSDVIPQKNFLQSPIKKLMEDTSLFGVGCMDESEENGKIVLRGRGTGTWSRGFLFHGRGEVDKTDTLWISGGSSVVRRALFEKLGGFDPLYNPFYWEDIDLSYRAQKSGYKVLFDSHSIVRHFHEMGAIKKTYKPSRVNEISYRNQFIFVWKNITNYALITNHLLYLPVHVANALKSGDTALLKGLFLALTKLPAIIKKRKKQKKLYTVSDVEVITKIK